ncbi:BirA family transcriptional regulator, biotin operon repressor / biotin-[acetyl-CoA-carboxylase] ligase [Friedmanniella luteola]|uniref:biotin--[biotin carboxyl-carrier protein] ligase n=1 Tax=Friedmanniella luteola TaxID=546871 RepID=A0A1H1YKF9_9ACTN|nr:BirA family transcriptional regulator, biotin operon repressor / biotin-[acetyl-CoA-carboxylase] ligase [Friedmanniella luteola]
MLDADVLRRELVRPGGLWSTVDVVERTGSTNADLAARARAGAPAGSVLVTDFQDAGRGRLGRTWVAPRGTSVAMSVLLRPADVDPARWTWLPLLAGLAVVEALRRAADVPALLKWPNDVLVDGLKVCGILAERVETPTGPACVLGMGVNVWLAADELPVPTATSLALLAQARDPGSRPPSRNLVIATVLAVLELLYQRWEGLDDDAPFAASYLQRSATLGRQVRVHLADDVTVEGRAEALDAAGRLVVRTATGVRTFGAGDVVHLRS